MYTYMCVYTMYMYRSSTPTPTRSVRAESFSSYGNPLPTTPNLDAFAKTGVRFEQAHVQHVDGGFLNARQTMI